MKVTAGRHFRTDLSVQKSERVNIFQSFLINSQINSNNDIIGEKSY